MWCYAVKGFVPRANVEADPIPEYANYNCVLRKQGSDHRHVNGVSRTTVSWTLTRTPLTIWTCRSLF